MSRPSIYPPRIGARLGLLLVVVGWLSGGLHHAIVDHDHDAATGTLVHACAGGDGDADAPSSTEGPGIQAASTGELHVCAIAIAMERALVEDAPWPSSGFAKREVAPLRAKSSWNWGGEPLHRLAPKGSPPVERLLTA